MKRYEAMFVVDSAACAKDFQAVRSQIHRLLERVGAAAICGCLYRQGTMATEEIWYRL